MIQGLLVLTLREKILVSMFLIKTYMGGTTSNDNVIPISRPPKTTVPMAC